MLINAIQKSSPALMFTSALSFDEFIEQNEFYSGLLRTCYDETRLPAAEQLILAEYPDGLNWMVVATEDAPDTIMVLPVLQRIVEACPRIDMHIVCEDDDLSRLMAMVDDPALPDDWDELDTPLLLIFDEEWQYQASWGPRPQAAEEKLDQWLEQHPEYEELSDSDTDEAQSQYSQLLHKLTYEMRVWYYDSLRAACVVEIGALLQSIQGESDEDDGDENGESDTGAGDKTDDQEPDNDARRLRRFDNGQIDDSDVKEDAQSAGQSRSGNRDRGNRDRSNRRRDNSRRDNRRDNNRRGESAGDRSRSDGGTREDEQRESGDSGRKQSRQRRSNRRRNDRRRGDSKQQGNRKQENKSPNSSQR